MPLKKYLVSSTQTESPSDTGEAWYEKVAIHVGTKITLSTMVKDMCEKARLIIAWGQDMCEEARLIIAWGQDMCEEARLIIA